MRLNIQLFAGGTITGTSTASIGRVQIIWTATASDAVENKSSVTATVQVKRSTAYNTTGTFSGTLWINGTAFSIKKKFDPISNSWKTIDTKTIDVQHNDDGTKTIEIKTSFSNTGTSMAGTYTASENVQLDTIARASYVDALFGYNIYSNSKIRVVHNITKRNPNFIDKITFCGQDFVIANGSSYTDITSGTAYNNFYATMGTDLEKNFTTTFKTYDATGTTQIGNDTSLTAKASLNNLDVVQGRTYSINVGNISAVDNNANAKITSTNADGSTYESQHKVSEFTSGNTYLQGWSDPKLSSQITISTHGVSNYTFGRPIVLSGFSTSSITLNGSAHTENVYLGTGFSADTYKLNATDGRKSATEKSITISRKSWTQPSVSITLTRQSATSQDVDWELTWSYTSVSRNDGNLNASLVASYSYNNQTTQLVNITSGLATSGTRSGTITLSNADDYKYPITANATLVDMIDYKVHSTEYEPPGLPALYVHKDSSSNNLVDIYGRLSVSGDTNLNGNLDVNGSSYFHKEIKTTGQDIVLGTYNSASNDSGDLVWTYGDTSEKARIWTLNEMSGGQPRLHYRSFDRGGNILVNDDYIALQSDIPNINILKIASCYKTITVPSGDSSLTLFALPSITGYSFAGIMTYSQGYADQWLISYGLYGGNIVAEIRSKYPSSLTTQIVVPLLYLRTDYLISNKTDYDMN